MTYTPEQIHAIVARIESQDKATATALARLVIDEIAQAERAGREIGRFIALVQLRARHPA